MPSKLANLHSFGLLGIRGYTVRVEVEASETSLMTFRIVGLPDTTVSESRERVRCAIHASGFHFPAGRVVVNLAPADVRKEGPLFDLPIAAGILAASKGLKPRSLQGIGMVGELSLDGQVRAVRGALSLAMQARQEGMRALVLPLDNIAEASLVDGIDLWPVQTLTEAVEALRKSAAPSWTRSEPPLPVIAPVDADLIDIRGLWRARRALEVAAAGGHNLLMIGPPGSGKTMLAHRLSGIMPPLTPDEALEVMQVHSAAGRLANGQPVTERPFRAPHHTASTGGIVGGGSVPRPGEISLAHKGVLFMDELPEFPRSVLEVLREPLESCQVSLARASITITFPADFLLVACMNPCPCGHGMGEDAGCKCQRTARMRYRARISGPLLDRMDMIVEVPRDHGDDPSETSAAVRVRATAARARQMQRQGRPNARLRLAEMRQHCVIDDPGLLTAAARTMSARSVDRVIRVARTLADLAGCEQIEPEHLQNALHLRLGEHILDAAW
ncbi:MAG TPA: YifB family Mg chelatase-like AAA ATPase [Candidatus Xenobia bacterium]|jgi:magnesium chelatase family protein